MAKKWYNLFVSVDENAAAAAAAAAGSAPPEKGGAPAPHGASPASSKSAAQTVADLAASIRPPEFSGPVGDPNAFEEIYAAAEIPVPPHGYTILKVAEMLQNEHIRGLARDVKRSSILVALDAAGVKIEEIIQDAVRRDRALDTYERVQQKALEELEARKNKENSEIQAEIDRLVAEQRARMQANDDETARFKERNYGWLLKKRQEEQRIAEAVAPFISENPITTGGGTVAPAPAPAPAPPDSGKQDPGKQQ